MEYSAYQQKIVDKVEITEEELDSIYIYLSIFMDMMKEEELSVWKNILEHIDKDYKNKDDE